MDSPSPRLGSARFAAGSWLVLSGLLCACSVYDPGNLYRDDPPLTPRSGRGGAPSAGTGGTGGMAGAAGAAGAAGEAGRAGGPARAGSGGVPGPDVEMGCGDGRVSPSEKCDIAIAAGEPGACPSECPPLANCVLRMLNGSNCAAECVELLQQCMDGDGCCPSRCDSSTDDDCSASCGDGIVQEDQGETCEEEPDEGAARCMTEEDCAAEDDDPCTNDVLTGDPKNCNVTCTHERITTLTPGDSCCPDGANANTDGDCLPRCGNAVTEGDEECDGGEGCDDQCKLTQTPEQRACLAEHAADGDECETCTCILCTKQAADCRDTDNAERDRLCGDLNACANDRDCAADVCYCGTSGALCGVAPNGPCRQAVERAAGSTNPFDVLDQSEMPGSAIGRALALGDCIVKNCGQQCR